MFANGSVAKSTRFIYICKDIFHNLLFLQTNQSNAAPLRNVAVVHIAPAKGVYFGFKTLSPKNGTTYRPRRNMGLNRKIAENNFFELFLQKLWKKFW